MIYYVEDDDNIRELVLYTLKQAGLEARGFESGEGFLKACALNKPELILLDVMLPGKDGFELLDALKRDANTRDTQVILITARGAEYDRVRGLDGGAEDYIVKPFGMMEFLSRVRAALRRNAPDKRRAIKTHGALALDIDRREARVNGLEVKLTYKEFELLNRLMDTPGMVLTREKLLSDVWGYDYAGGTRTVDVHVLTLRQKLGAGGDAIETVRGVGYRLGGGGQ